MKIQITARHFHASPQLHQNLQESLERLAKFNDSITGAHIILDAAKSGVRRAEGIVKILDKSVCAHAEEDVMGKAIDAMLEKIERQLKKENEKLKVHKSIPAAAAVMA
ncbi:MAG TPA: ribosome-associated translation inhibitor RaiA [Fibrobacteres bacterium]|nr:ribosome-associated translation inhibitor RaiA [Fibrobacterota bacterium]